MPHVEVKHKVLITHKYRNRGRGDTTYGGKTQSIVHKSLGMEGNISHVEVKETHTLMCAVLSVIQFTIKKPLEE